VFSTRRLLFNAFTFMPGAMQLPLIRRRLVRRATGTGGTNQARYCYATWLRHLVHAGSNRLNTNPRVVAELGPGDSIGIGLAAILTGAEQYYAFDVVAHANIERNLAIFEGLVELFKSRANIPDSVEFPKLEPSLPEYSFPHHLLSSERLDAALDPSRLERIRESIRRQSQPNSMIHYRAPWNTSSTILPNSVDLIFSQAVLEHVDDLEDVYRALHTWLRPGGYMSHEIDFKCHDSAREWNGHWTYSEAMWTLVRGKDVWLINRVPHSVHIRLMQTCGFQIVEDTPVQKPCKFSRRRLARRFRDLTDDDLITSEAFVQAVKISH
jgi:methyltransferase family protein